MAGPIIPPRRNEPLTNKGSGTVRFMDYLEKATAISNDSVEQIETNRVNIIALTLLVTALDARVTALEQAVIDIELRLDALDLLVVTPVLTAISYQATDGVSEAIKCNNTSSIDITLPTNPVSQQLVSIKRVGAVVNLIGNGRLIDGMATVKMTRIYTNLPLVYTLSTNTWDIQ